jgi:hypothetical protein
MRRLSIIPVVLLCVTAALTGLNRAAPGWASAAGIDFWNLGEYEDGLRGTIDRERELEAQCRAAEYRSEAAERIAGRLGAGDMTFAEAVDALSAVADADPEWFAEVRGQFPSAGRVSPTATDRDILAELLLRRIRSTIRTAEASGDDRRVAALSARLTQLESVARHAAAE